MLAAEKGLPLKALDRSPPPPPRGSADRLCVGRDHGTAAMTMKPAAGCRDLPPRKPNSRRTEPRAIAAALLGWLFGDDDDDDAAAAARRATATLTAFADRRR